MNLPHLSPETSPEACPEKEFARAGLVQGRRQALAWRLRSRELALGSRTLVMGIVNVTADSFSDGGRYLEPGQAIEHALRLLDEGADLLDFGAESTRPGAQAGDPQSAAVSAAEEQDRLLPVLEGVLRARPEAVISVDTYKAATARAGVAAGAEIVNDVSGFTWDRGMASTCAGLGCGVVAMHTRGMPGEWKDLLPLAHGSVVPMVRSGLAQTLETAHRAGIAREALVLDPGYGFGKRMQENYDLLAGQGELLTLGRPLLVGLSRKGFLGSGQPDKHADGQARETASLAAMVTAILSGASIVRVHSVRQAKDAADIADAVLDAGNSI